MLLPARLPFCHSPGLGRAAHSITARGVDCAGVLPPARLSSRQSPGRGVRSPTSVATAGASRLARSPLVPHPARQVSSSRRLGHEHPERTFSKATPTRTRPGLHSFARALLVHILFPKPVRPRRWPLDFQPFAGYSSAPLPSPLSGAAGLTCGSALLFLSLSRTYASLCVYGSALASAQPGQPVRPPAGRRTACRPGCGGDVTAGDVTSPPGNVRAGTGAGAHN